MSTRLSERRPHSEADVLVGAGSNVDPENNIPDALRALQRHAADIRLMATSTFYGSPARDRPEQPDYRNGVFRLRTRLAPRELQFGLLRDIEHALGRRRSSDAYAARPIDLDLLLFGDLVCGEADLTLPDPELSCYAYVAVPAAELLGDRRLPGSTRKLRDIAEGLPCGNLVEDTALSARLREMLLHEQNAR